MDKNGQARKQKLGDGTPGGYGPQENPPVMKEVQAAAVEAAQLEQEKTASSPLKGSSRPPKKLTNMERLYHTDKGENFMFDGCVRSILWCLGESHELDFGFVSALSGDMFTQTYCCHRAEGENPTDYSLSSLTEKFFTPDIFEHVMAVCGYESLYISPEDIERNPGWVMEQIMASIDRGIPVMSWQIANAPVQDHIIPLEETHVLIGGYSGNAAGDLYVNFYREDALCDEWGFATIHDGLSGSKGIFIAGEKVRVPSLADVYKNAVLFLPKWLNKAPAGGYCFGIGAFEEWERTLLDDSVFAGMREDNYKDYLWNHHCSALLIVCSYGADAYQFVCRCAQLNPGFKAGEKLISLFDHILNLGREIHFEIQGDFEPSYEQFGDPAFRRRLAHQIHRFAQAYKEVAAVCSEKKDS